MKSLFPATTLVTGILSLLVLLAGQSSARAADPALVIDAGVDGNSATTVGTIENCVSVKTGDRFQMDIVVQDITDLLAWEIPIDYEASVVTVVDQDVKLFQQANQGSSVLDLSAKLPDDSGFHQLRAVDSADPASPDTGTGVLARITFEANASGDSPIRFGNRDYDSNGTLDAGVLLRNVATDFIGDTNGDTFYDGEREGAQVVVDGACPPGAVVAKSPEQQNTNSSGGSSFPWLVVGGGAIGVIVVLAGAVILLSRRRSAPAVD
jgi:hypothetical protein